MYCQYREKLLGFYIWTKVLSKTCKKVNVTTSNKDIWLIDCLWFNTISGVFQSYIFQIYSMHSWSTWVDLIQKYMHTIYLIVILNHRKYGTIKIPPCGMAVSIFCNPSSAMMASKQDWNILTRDANRIKNRSVWRTLLMRTFSRLSFNGILYHFFYKNGFTFYNLCWVYFCCENVFIKERNICKYFIPIFNFENNESAICIFRIIAKIKIVYSSLILVIFKANQVTYLKQSASIDVFRSKTIVREQLIKTYTIFTKNGIWHLSETCSIRFLYFHRSLGGFSQCFHDMP